jgi:dethiobiotin synthetase
LNAQFSEQSVVDAIGTGRRVEALREGEGADDRASNQHLASQNRSEKVVLVETGGILPFADVVDVIDICRLTGAKVVLVTPGP